MCSYMLEHTLKVLEWSPGRFPTSHPCARALALSPPEARSCSYYRLAFAMGLQNRLGRDDPFNFV